MNSHAGDLIPVENDPLEQAGQNILGLLEKASAIAEQKTQSAINTAHRLSFELRACEERIKELEAALRFQYARADRAEEWLKRISNEIAQRLPSSQSAPIVPAVAAHPAPAHAALAHPATSQPAPAQPTGTHPEIELYVKGRRKVS